MDKSHKYPKYQPLSNFIPTSLMSINSLVHPVISYSHFRNWDGKTPFKERVKFYEKIDEFCGEMKEKQSEDILEIKRCFLEKCPELDLSGVYHMKEWYLKNHNTTIKDRSSFQKIISSNIAYKGLLYPMKQVEGGWIPDFKSRVYTEDIPTGLAVIKGIGELVGAVTPTIDEILQWNQKQMGKEYIVDGKFKGKDIGETRAPQAYGIHDVNEYVRLSK